jgi:hypothetical protein
MSRSDIAQLKADAKKKGSVLFIDDSLMKSLERLDFIVDAVAYKGLTYKEASFLWDEDGTTTLHSSVETIN